jgi:hypothetical protein
MNQLNGEGYGRGGGVLAGYAFLVAVFHMLFIGFLTAMGRRHQKLPKSIAVTDILLLGTATYKLSRVISKDSVTSFIRAPFTVYRGPAGSSEVKEDVRGTGVRKAIGELLTCPFCLGMWVAAVLSYGLVLQTRITRLVAAIFTIATLADALQYGFEALRKSAEESDSSPQGEQAKRAQGA